MTATKSLLLGSVHMVRVQIEEDALPRPKGRLICFAGMAELSLANVTSPDVSDPNHPQITLLD